MVLVGIDRKKGRKPHSLCAYSRASLEREDKDNLGICCYILIPGGMRALSAGLTLLLLGTRWMEQAGSANWDGFFWTEGYLDFSCTGIHHHRLLLSLPGRQSDTEEDIQTYVFRDLALFLALPPLLCTALYKTLLPPVALSLHFKQGLPCIPVSTEMFPVSNAEIQESLYSAELIADHMCKKSMLPQRQCLAVQLWQGVWAHVSAWHN